MGRLGQMFVSFPLMFPSSHALWGAKAVNTAWLCSSSPQDLPEPSGLGDRFLFQGQVRKNPPSLQSSFRREAPRLLLQAFDWEPQKLFHASV